MGFELELEESILDTVDHDDDEDTELDINGFIVFSPEEALTE